MRQIACICFALISISLCTFSQDKRAFKQLFVDAEYAFMTEEYAEALGLYLELLNLDPENANLHFLTGACYLSIYGEKEKAIPHLEKAVESMSIGYREGSYKEKNAPRESLFALARAFHIQHEFDLAIEHYQKYRNIMFKRNFAEVEYVNAQIKSCELAMSMVRQPVAMRFLRMGERVNRFSKHYNPVVSVDDSTLFYMTDQPVRRTIMVMHRTADGWTDPRSINDEVGAEGDCFPTCLSADGKELFLVKKNYMAADIYVSYRKGERWTPMVKLNNHINSDYFETHAFISYNGKVLFFTSDRPGGQGAMDIWVSETTTEGDWGPPINLGPKINSHYNEETPFLTENGKKMYFSSQGHASMGGYDIFIAEQLPSMQVEPGGGLKEGNSREEMQISSWSFPVNAGYPISSVDDDLFYIPRDNGKRGYYAVIIDSISSIRSIYTLMPGQEEPLKIAAIQQGLNTDVETGGLKTSRLQRPADSAGTIIDTALTTPVEPPPQADPDIYYVLNSILFGFDSYDLTSEAEKEADRIIEAMRNNPSINLELTGHADAIGASPYNLRLSERRAQSVADYLIRSGIPKERIKVIGAGETRPIALNKYEDGTDSPEGRRLNRHVSLKLENLTDEKVRVQKLFVPDHLKPKKDQSFSILLVNSDRLVDTIPDEVEGEEVALIITDSAFLYTAGNYQLKTDALMYLNEVIDKGYDDAGILEKSDLEQLIARLSAGGNSVKTSFTIQIMALRRPVSVNRFLPLKGVKVFKGSDGLHRYVYGEYDEIDGALNKLPALKDMGYHDAFIMSVLRYRRL